MLHYCFSFNWSTKYLSPFFLSSIYREVHLGDHYAEQDPETPHTFKLIKKGETPSNTGEIHVKQSFFATSDASL